MFAPIIVLSPKHMNATAISLLSLLLSIVALSWNIYRDVLLRGRIKVGFHVGRGNLGGVSRIALLTVVNLGPGQVSIQGTTLHEPRARRGTLPALAYLSIAPRFDTPISGMLPAMLPVGEKLTLTLPYEETSFLQFPGIGVTDSFGRSHYASRRDHHIARQEHVRDFSHE